MRLDDTRGQEHIKLSTEYGGKSQLNLGHLVDAERKKRGEGFELRTDDWGSLRAGKGVFISADAQPKGQGPVLDMSAALEQLNNALSLVNSLAQSAVESGALAADLQSQKGLMAALGGLEKAGLVASAPDGIALTTPADIQLSAWQNLTATAGDSADISVLKRFSVAAGEAISLFAQKLGMKLLAARGPVEIQAQSDAMTLLAEKNMTICSVNGELVLTAPEGITLASGGAFLKIKNGAVTVGAPEGVRVESDDVVFSGSAALEMASTAMAIKDPIYANPLRGRFQVKDPADKDPVPYVPYRIVTADGRVIKGVTDAEGYTQRHHGLDPQNFQLFVD
ncbi:type VI secretion system Vgr family protein [Pseudomonas sp. Leaf48]|uniref:DUF2345 domain-containing protein n=1 Tax=Pseudomonas sp. Leaf48 TaxID=1736221 RepID=UPI00191C429C